MPDALLLNRLREQVAQDQNDTIRLQVKKGGVTIQGTVRDDAHRESVLSTVAGTSGVVWMEDRLQMDGNKRRIRRFDFQGKVNMSSTSEPEAIVS
jgi:osmotically-inducible protein OsmY